MIVAGSPRRILGDFRRSDLTILCIKKGHGFPRCQLTELNHCLYRAKSEAEWIFAIRGFDKSLLGVRPVQLGYSDAG